MGTSLVDPIDLMVRVIEEHSPESIWRDSRLAGYRQLGNTNAVRSVKTLSAGI